MKELFSSKPILFLLLFCLLIASWLCQEKPVIHPSERYFDTAEPFSEDIRLAILYPSVGSIRAIIELREQGMITIPNLTVIGVYHQMEGTDYEKSKDFVREKNLSWFHFHQVSGELERNSLFEKNTCSDDFAKIFKKSDGIIFFGGADIPPYIYNQKTSLLTQIHTPYRHFLELSFIFHLLGGHQNENHKPLLESKLEFPVLGICLGAQSLNIGTGGTLIQDISSEKYSVQYFEDVMALGRENWHVNPYARIYPEEKLFPYNMHPIKFREDSKFWSVLRFSQEDTPYILSAHHQMVDRLGKGIKIAATSLDGKVVEAIEHEKYPHVLGVQFHPEFPILWDSSLELKFTPQDKEKTNLPAFLSANPPSFDFHKKLWAWFSQRLKDNHAKGDQP